MALTRDSGVAGASLAVDEETDLALLDQHLRKTNTLSQRMTSILSQLDSRLSKLDKAIAPLGIREITRQDAAIDAALTQLGAKPHIPPSESYGNRSIASIAETASVSDATHGTNGLLVPAAPSASTSISNSQTFGKITESKRESIPATSVMDRKRAIPRPDVIPRWQENPTGPGTPQREAPPPGGERAILSRGPDSMSLGEYFGALDVVIVDLEQMHQGLVEGRGGTREQGVNELLGVVEDAFNQLTRLLLRKVKESMPKYFDPETLVASAPPAVTTYYPALAGVKPLARGLIRLCEPNTPTPRTTELLTPMMGQCISELSAIRGEWLKRSLASLAGRIDEVDGNIWEGRNGVKVRLVQSMWDAFLVAAAAEKDVAENILPGDAGAHLVNLILPHGMMVISNTMNQVIATIKRSLSTQTMVLLDLYAMLMALQPRYNATLDQVLQDPDHEVRGALNGPLSQLRQLALRSFPERLVDIRAPSRSPVATADVDEVTYTTLDYLEQLPSFGNLVETLLKSSGKAERSWLMGMNEPPSSARSAADEGGVLNLYAADVLGTLIIHLEQRAKTMRQPVSSTFLVNNLSHMRNATASFNADIIGPGAEDMLNKRFRDAKSAYLHEWTALTQLLQHTAQARFGSSDKQSTKEAAAAFFERLADLESSCRQHPISRKDPDLRDRIAQEVDDVVRGAYNAFYNKAHSRGYDKYLKATPEELHRRVSAVFR